MATLHLGVVDVGYTEGGTATTTGDVAGYLENKYHIMRSFAELKGPFIQKCLVDAAAGALESAAQGRPYQGLDVAGAMSRIEDSFRQFLDRGEMQRLLPPSQRVSDATLKTSLRKKNKKVESKRQAFIDTGLYQASFRAWVTK